LYTDLDVGEEYKVAQRKEDRHIRIGDWNVYIAAGSAVVGDILFAPGLSYI
jgi:serine acetyltransferase